MITLIVGLPGSGKTTLAKKLISAKGGLVFDMDYLSAALTLSEPVSQSKAECEFSISRKVAASLRSEFLRWAPTYTSNVVIIRTAPTDRELAETKPNKIIVCTNEWVKRPYKYDREAIMSQINDVIAWADSNNVPVETIVSTRSENDTCPWKE